ncbi:unnamed protein product [Onchocerca ochengi]|uniref:Helitron_like_N domain-containing protein n=1 Tax=Onchocerca ochengi TaxID=42157 RepID=A0A182E7L2_ONCOC|nr:unnamed protein product [Onchocerca ochengi]
MKVRKRCSVRYKKEAEITTERIRNIRRALLARFVCFVSNQTNQRETIQMARQTTANLHWLSLTIFSGDPQKWRELWSNFEAAVHRQQGPLADECRVYPIAKQRTELYKQLICA